MTCLLSPTPPVSPGPAAAAPAEGAADEPGAAFAQALDQAEAQQRDAGPAGADLATQCPDGRTKAHVAGPSRQATARGARGAEAAADAQPADTMAEARTETEATLPAAESPERDDEAAAEPVQAEPTPQELAAWISALPLPRPPAAPPADTGPPPARRADAPPSGKEAVTMTSSHAAARAMPEPAASPRPKEADTAPASAPSPPRPATPDAAPAPATGAEAAVNPQAALAAAPSATPAHGPKAPPVPFHDELRAAVGSDDFAPALGARLSVLVRDGIEHAQLKLNPANLGPVEVRIDLDGHRAQVDFSAAHAATRQALQEAVPALASALREQGLTLTGGGVFEQPREQRGDAQPQGRHGTSPGTERGLDDTLPAAAAPRPVRTRGVLDLYA